MPFPTSGRQPVPLCPPPVVACPAGQACLGIALAVAMLAAPALASGQTAVARLYDIPAGRLEDVLARFGRESGILLSFRPEATAALQSQGLRGRYTVGEGLAALLSGTPIQIRRQPDGSYLLVRAAAPAVLATMPVVTVRAPARQAALPQAYAGGQVARGGGLGILGVTDALDAPFSTLNYTADTLHNQQARTLADVVQNEASVRVLTGSGGFGEDFQIRGFAVPSGDVGLNGLYGLTSASRMPAIMMERVEVVKGPGTLMNGNTPNGSTGGNINIVTKRAPDAALTRLSTVYQSQGQWGEQVDVGRRFGRDHQWGMRFNGEYRTGETGVDQSRQRQAVGVLNVDYAGPRLDWSLDAYTQHEDVDNLRPQIAFTPGATRVPSPPSGRSNFFPGTALALDDSVVATRADYAVNDHLVIHGAIGYRRGSADQTLPSARVDADGHFFARSGYYDSYSRTRTGNVGLRARFDALGVSHTLALGATQLNQVIGNVSAQSREAVLSSLYDPARLPDVPSPRGRPRQASDTALSSWYLSDTLAIADDRLRVTLGMRHQRITVDNTASLTGAPEASYDTAAVSPLAGVVFRPVDNVALYANAASDVTRSGTAPARAANAGHGFAPYKSRQYEAGVKVDWGRLSTVASAFQITLPNAVVDPVTNLYGFDGEQRNRGLEFAVYGEITRGLRVMASGAFYDATLTGTQLGVNDGNRADGVPSHTAYLSLDWDTPWVPGLSLSARVIHTSSMDVDAANALRLPSWTRHDVGARYRTRVLGKRVVLRANVENVFDERVWLVSGTHVTVNSPRTLLLSAQIDF